MSHHEEEDQLDPLPPLVLQRPSTLVRIASHIPTTPITNISSTSPSAIQRRDTRATIITVVNEEVQNAEKLASLPFHTKMILLMVFSLAQFIDVMNVSAMFIATTTIAEAIDVSITESVWVITAYSITFASWLLFAGRLADLYSPQKLFIAGFFALGCLCLGVSWITNKYAFFVVRAISGVFGALTIPSAINIIVHLFPDKEQQQAYLGLFQLSGALGNVFGLLIAGLLELKSWNWIFRFIAIVVLPLCILCWWLLPKEEAPSTPAVLDDVQKAIAAEPRWKRLDFLGSFLIMGTLILFILGLTDGSTKGWTSAGFLVPFLLSCPVGFVSFFLWEYFSREDRALLPRVVWSYPNFIAFSVVALIPYWTWACSQVAFATWSQAGQGHSPLLSAVRLLPQGIAALLFGIIATMVPSIISRPFWTIIVGELLAAVGVLLCALSKGGGGNDYWRFLFPGFLLLSFGTMCTFISASAGVIMATPPETSGVAGGFFNVILQTGAAIGLSIQQGLFGSVGHNDIHVWKGQQDGLWMVLASIGVLVLIFVCLYRKPEQLTVEDVEANGGETGGRTHEKANKNAGEMPPDGGGRSAPVTQ